MIGPAAVGFRAYRGDNLPTGFYVLSGIHVVHSPLTAPAR
jgi:hypothetical protein